jgi:hypothetical protein
MTLEDDLRKLADLRDEHFKLDAQLEMSRQAWLEENAELIMKRSALDDQIKAEEEFIRRDAVTEFTKTGNKKPAPGLQIKIVEKLEYPEEDAVKWATYNNALGVLKIAKSKFDKAMKGESAKGTAPAFLTVTKVPQAQIATDLRKVIEND